MRVDLSRFRFAILCEDTRHQKLLRLYLAGRGVEMRKMSFFPLPKGRGSGEQHVRETFPRAVHTHRTRGWENRALLVMVDGDKDPTRKQQLLALLSPGRAKEERIIVLVPRRNVETWLFAFSRGGCDVDEQGTDYKNNFREGDVQQAVQNMVSQCHGSGFPSAPLSFLDAVQEWQRLGQ
ncbi:MAG: hypothetical protein H7837_05120 [Magnetococcus sp. MYC-9]